MGTGIIHVGRESLLEWHCRAVLVFSAEYLMPDTVHPIRKKNTAGNAGRNYTFRVYA